MESVDAGRMGHINKNDWCAVNKAAGRNRSRKCILHWSVRAARAHAALLATDGFLFHWFLLRQPGVQKQRRTNRLHRGRPEKAPRLAGSREWHDAQFESFNPMGIFAQSRRAGLTNGKEKTTRLHIWIYLLSRGLEFEFPRARHSLFPSIIFV